MKSNRINFLIIVSIITLFTACKEEVPAGLDLTPVDITLIDTSYMEAVVESPDYKVVLFEDFTGVKCQACPSGHQEANNIKATYNDSIVIVGLHNFDIEGPYSGYPKLEIDEAFEIRNMLGSAASWPAASIDRIAYGTDEIEESIGNWAGHVSQAVKVPSSVNIDITSTYDVTTRELIVLVKLHLTQIVSDQIGLSVSITEDSINAAQKFPIIIDPVAPYIQRHVLRDMLTPSVGTALSENNIAGRVYEKEFKLTNVPTGWNEDQCEIVAFVHKTGSNTDVLQTASEHMK